MIVANVIRILPRIGIAMFVTVAPSQASATWSIIAMDKATGQIAIALASCVDADANDAVRLTAVVVPGRGAATCQAASDMTNADQSYIFRALRRGFSPARIMAHLRAGPHYRKRQYGLVDARGGSASTTGPETKAFASGLTGRIVGTGIVYSIQGNIVTKDVVPSAANAFVSTRGSILDRAIAALEAGDRAGGDTRCVCPTPSSGERASPPCDDLHAHLAYLLLTDRSTALARTSEEQSFALKIDVSPPGKGSGAIDFAKGESLNPVRTLRLRYDAWRQKRLALRE